MWKIAQIYVAFLEKLNFTLFTMFEIQTQW